MGSKERSSTGATRVKPRRVLENPLVQVALAGMVQQAALAAREMISRRASRALFSEVRISSREPTFDWVVSWLSRHPDAQRATTLRAVTTRERKRYDDEDGESKDSELVFIPSYGSYTIRFRGRRVWVSHYREESSSLKNLIQDEEIVLRVFGKDVSILRDLIEEARQQELERSRKYLKVYVAQRGWWEQSQSLMRRPLDSVILPEGVAELVRDDLAKFLASEDWYREKGIPYRRGYLFYGEPGSGKSSLAIALASEFDLPVYWMSLQGEGMDDNTLVRLLQNMQRPSILLLEDIDTAFDGRESEGKVTFSGLLNALDGVVATHTVVVMTTNHLDKIDPALIRPGRVDLKVAFGKASESQLKRLYLRFFPNDTVGAARFAVEARGSTIAEAQEEILRRVQHGDSVSRP